MALQVNRVTNANIYLNGGSQLGRAEKVKLPDIAQKMVEHKALGMVGTLELPSGVDKMDGEIKWSSFYADALIQVANPYATQSLMIRANIESWNSAGLQQQTPFVAILTVIFSKLPLGDFKQHDNVEMSSPFACYYVNINIGGLPIVEFDPMANIYKVAGNDVLAQFRANVGS